MSPTHPRSTGAVRRCDRHSSLDRGSDGYYRGGGDHASLIVLRGEWVVEWVVEVITAGPSKRNTLEIASSLDIT
jgi:hypothetical protein